MASIVPRPRWFKYSFNDTTQRLAAWNSRFFEVVGGILRDKDVLSQQQLDSLSIQDVVLTGPARHQLRRRLPQNNLPPTLPDSLVAPRSTPSTATRQDTARRPRPPDG